MGKESVEVLIQGGKATAAPPLGPALGPMGVNIGQVVADINKKTEDFKGMQVPVTVSVDTDSKEYEISIGTPPTSELVKKEAEVKKGAGNPLTEKVADLKIEQVIKVSKMKESALLGKNNFSRVKEVIGTCQSMGILVEGMPAHEAFEAVAKGKWKKEIEQGKSEITAEERKELDEERKHLQEELEKQHEVFEKQAKGIMEEMKGKEGSQIRKKMVEEGIPDTIIHELVPEEREAK
jgi:large subunit ribosomal protein L11